MEETLKRKVEAEILGNEYLDSIKTLYAGCFDQLVGYLQTRFRSCPHQAKEVAQQAFEQVVARKDCSPIDNIKAFLWRTAHNIAISEFRSQKVANKYQAETRLMLHGGEGHTHTPERLLEAREQLEIVKGILRAMPEQRRRAFILTRIEGLSFTEASMRLGISRPAVSKHVARAAADLYVALHSDVKDRT